MTAELVKFLGVMFVLVVGFAMSFYALSGGQDTFGDTCLNLFKGMMGEVGLFDKFSDLDDDGDYGSVLSSVATLLLVVYLVVITIMLLNLLIAVLSTSHARVEKNAEREFKVSKARLVKHYRMVVERDLLPAPFNLLQVMVSSLCMIKDRSWKRKGHGRANRVVGQAIFGLVMSPVAVAAGTILWVLSGPYCPLAWRRYYLKHEQRKTTLYAKSMVGWYLFFCAWCLVGAPLYLLAFCLREPLSCIRRLADDTCRNHLSSEATARGRNSGTDVHDMLKDAPGGVPASDLQKYIDDPLSDPEVRHDEKNRSTTVEHIKLLRNRLEQRTHEMLQDEVSALKPMMKDTLDAITAMNERVRNLEAKVSEMGREIRESRRETGGI